MLDKVKRLSTDTPEKLHHKLPRRNSEQSFKSDSSRISNVSDKINRIDTFEKMEVTLGNDDVARVSISEDVSCDSSSKSSTSENSVELKRKPVQVDIDNNAEFTISPSNKLKISDALIKRLSDASDDSPPKVDRVKKNLVVDESPPRSSMSPSIAESEMISEKFKEVVEDEVVDLKVPLNEESSTEISTSEEKETGKNNSGVLSKCFKKMYIIFGSVDLGRLSCIFFLYFRL